MLDSGKSNSRAQPASGTPTYAHPPTTHKPFHPFTPEETSTIQHHLDQPIEADQIQFRPSAQGSVAYVEGWKALSLANEVFGFNGWSSEILYWGVDFVDCEDARVSLGISCMVRIHLRDGTFHDDIGYGSAENQRSKAAAYEKARKEAVTDAMKRALRVFGNRLGNCAYDKAFLKQVRAASSHAPYRPHGTHQPTSTTSTTSTTSNGSHTAPTLPPIKISSNHAPVNFAPQWKHPKTVNNHEANPSAAPATRPPPPVPLASNMADSEMELDLVVTEEQLLEFGSFLAGKNDIDLLDPYHSSPRASRSHPSSSSAHSTNQSLRSEFRSGSHTMPVVTVSANQLRPPPSK